MRKCCDQQNRKRGSRGSQDVSDAPAVAGRGGIQGSRSQWLNRGAPDYREAVSFNVLYLESLGCYPALINFNLIPTAVKDEREVVAARDLTTDEKVMAFLSRLLPVTKDAKNG